MFDCDKYSKENIPEELKTSRHIKIIYSNSNGRYDIKCATVHYKKFNGLIIKHKWPTYFCNWNRKTFKASFNIEWTILDIKKSKNNNYPKYVRHNTNGPAYVSFKPETEFIKEKYFLDGVPCNSEEEKLIKLGLM